MSIEAMIEEGSYTPDFPFLRGEYNIGESSLPYFNVSLTVDDARKFISLPRDVVFDATEPIALEELFQRELDEERVREKLVPYLKSPHKAKFFNSLTVALLPIDDQRRNKFLPGFDGGVRKSDDGAFDCIDVGPVRVRTLKSHPGIGFIKWDDRRARAVVLDGQHRLFGLLEVAGDATFRGRDQLLRDTRIPVILLVLDRELGFRPPEGSEDASLLGHSRTIFIDLNKHSVRVSPERQYLLDDLDLFAVCMRGIMGSEAGAPEGAGAVADRIAATGRIPLALVDWYSGKAKFDRTSSSLHITSSLVLYDHVASALAVPSVVGTDYKRAKQFVDGVVSRLSLPTRNPALAKSINRHYENVLEDEVPFALLEGQVRELAVHFRETIGRVIVSFLTGALPYAELIAKYEEAGFLGGTYEAWLALDDVGKAAFPVDEAEERPGVRARALVDPVKESYPLAYQVVYQRAFIDCLIEMVDLREELAQELGLPAEFSAFVDAIVDRFNAVVAPQLAAADPGEHSPVWVGAGLRSNRTIDFTKASQRAIAGFTAVALTAPLNDFDASMPDAVVGEWVASRIRRGSKTTAVDAIVSQGGKNWKQRVKRVIKEEFLAREEDAPTDERLDELFQERAGRIMKSLAAAASSS